MSFSIDLVRDTFKADVTRLLGDIETTAKDLLASPLLGVSPTQPEPLAQMFRVIGDDGHALHGTTSLVSADSLAATARLVEKLAEHGQEELRRAEECARRARAVADLFALTAGDMRQMLDLELEHKAEEAQWLAVDWQGRAEALLAEIVLDQGRANAKRGAAPAVSDRQEGEGGAGGAEEEFTFAAEDDISEAGEPAAAPGEFDFGDGGEAADGKPDGERAERLDLDAPAEVDPIRAELVAIFQQEARELVTLLAGHLTALAGEPANMEIVSAIERVLHTLRGASATVGLGDVSAEITELQRRAEGILERGERVSAEALGEIVSAINAAIARVELPPIVLGDAKPALRTTGRDEGTREAYEDFRRDAREVTCQVANLVDRLGGAGQQAGADVRAQIGRLMHRLKGSALVVGEEHIAQDAAEHERMCDDGTATSATLSRALAAIRLRLGLDAPALTGSEARNADAADAELAETRAVFLDEARRLYVDATALLGALEKGAEATPHDAQVELAALLHRLKGSASVVAHETVAAEASALHALCDPSSTSSFSFGALKDGLARIAALLQIDAAASVGRAGSTGAFPASELAGAGAPASEASSSVAAPVREAVQVAADPELWQAFTQECAELLDALESDTFALEESTSPKERIRTLMRNTHTLKGVLNTIGLVPTGKVVHRVEDFLEGLLAAPVLPAMRSVATFLLAVQSDVRRNLRQAEKGWVETSIERVESNIARVLAGRVAKEASASSAGEARAADASVRSPASSAGSRRDASDASANEGADRRFIKVATERLDVLMNLAGELVVSRSRLLSRVEVLRVLQAELGRGSRRLVETVDAFRQNNEYANLDGRRIAAIARRTAALPAQLVAAGAGGAVAGAASHPTDVAMEGAAWASFSDLELDRYDDVHVLARRVAEITNDFQEISGQLERGLTSLTDDSDAFGGIVSGIQSEVTRARMVPLELLFARLRLPVRDAASRESKEVRVVTRGEEVNVDKTIADALFQPMLHLVRNAVAHGIESPANRDAAGKARVGTVALEARQESGQIVIEIRDDGRGLDLEALRARGVAMGLVPADVAPADPIVKDLVFAPGLSTHASAGAVAGRGVGCDVVRRAVERLNGSIRVDSTAGKGTVFVVTLPITLAITKALLVRHQNQSFAIPLYFAERIVDAQEQRVVESAGVRRIQLDEAYMAVRTLAEAFGGVAGDEAGGPVIVLRVGDQRLLLQVDAVVGQEEIVVKHLGALLAGHPLLAGVSLRGNGELVLILDAPGLVEAKGAAVPRREARNAARPQPSEDSPKPGAAPPPRPAIEARRLRVLFVDDSLSVRKVAESNLRGLGVDVTLAVDGLDALEKLREGNFDLVFTDLEMPRMHGYELIRELRFLPAYRALPIVVVTSRSGQKHQEQAKQLGATDYLTKPFTAQTLEAAIKRWGGRTGDPDDGVPRGEA